MGVFVGASDLFAAQRAWQVYDASCRQETIYNDTVRELVSGCLKVCVCVLVFVCSWVFVGVC